MRLTIPEALALHGAIVSNPSYREGADALLDAILTRLEGFIVGRDEDLHSVKVQP